MWPGEWPGVQTARKSHPGSAMSLIVLDEDVGQGHVQGRLDLHGGEGEVRQLVLGHPRHGQELAHPVHQPVGVVVARVQELGVGRVQPDPGP